MFKVDHSALIDMEPSKKYLRLYLLSRRNGRLPEYINKGNNIQS